jgi:hypothetical protein
MTDLANYSYPVAMAQGDGQPIRRGLTYSVVVVLAVAVTMVARAVLWRYGFPVSQHVLSMALAAILLGFMGMLAMNVRRNEPPVPPKFLFGGKLIIMTVWVALLIGFGLARDNIPNVVFKEAVVFLIFILLMFVGRFDGVWRAMHKPLVVVFYVGFILVLLTYHTPGLVTSFEGTVEADTKYLPRNLDTIGYSLRGILDCGLLLAAWGLSSRKNDIWRWLMIGTLPAYLMVQALIFEFRGSIVLVGVLLITYVLILPLVQRRISITTILALGVAAVIGMALASKTEAYASLMKRFNREQLFATRFEENNAFMRDMSDLDLAIGRGMGGWYRGPRWGTGIYYMGEYHWAANHFGFMGFVLRGGFLMLVFLITFALPAVLPKGSGWYDLEYNRAAFLLAPMLLLNILINPIIFTPDAFFLMLVVAMCLARFNTPPTDVQTWPTTESNPQDHYEYSSY